MESASSGKVYGSIICLFYKDSSVIMSGFILKKCLFCFPTISGIGCDSISSVAVCAGSGGGLLKNLNVSLYVTGEMSHHDVLHAAQSGVSVILCDHSNTERGFLKVLQESLTKVFQNQVDIQVSKSDKDPLDVV